MLSVLSAKKLGVSDGPCRHGRPPFWSSKASCRSFWCQASEGDAFVHNMPCGLETKRDQKTPFGLATFFFCSCLSAFFWNCRCCRGEQIGECRKGFSNLQHSYWLRRHLLSSARDSALSGVSLWRCCPQKLPLHGMTQYQRVQGIISLSMAQKNPKVGWLMCRDEILPPPHIIRDYCSRWESAHWPTRISWDLWFRFFRLQRWEFWASGANSSRACKYCNISVILLSTTGFIANLGNVMGICFSCPSKSLAARLKKRRAVKRCDEMFFWRGCHVFGFWWGFTYANTEWT